MMPKHSSRAPWGRRLTATVAVSLLTLGACSDSDSGVGPSTIEVVEIVTIPNNQTLTNLIPGNTRQMLAAPTNSSGNFIDRPVTWASSNPAAATITDAGLVTAVAGGSTWIRATAGGKTDSVAVGVRYPVGAIALTPATVVLRREGLQQMTASLTDTQGAVVTGRTVTWSSSVPTVATISATGLISATATAVDGSQTVITATVANTNDGGNAVTATRLVTVTGNAVVSSVSIAGDPAFASLTSGLWGTPSSVQLTATALSGLGNTIAAPITFSTSAAGIATVDGSGLVAFAGDTGTVTITATAAGAGNGGADVSATAQFRAQTRLLNGVPAAANAPTAGNAWFAFFVPETATQLTVTLNGTTGDGDLYLYRPGSAAITHSSFNDGTDEEIVVVRGAPAGNFTGWWYVRMNAWSGAPAVTDGVVTATHNAP
jgi:trimeric autotransporter adhesin